MQGCRAHPGGSGDLLQRRVRAVTGGRLGGGLHALQEAVERGLLSAMVNEVERINENGSPARPEIAQALGLLLTDFRTWAGRTFS
ncbi:hypothetical protein ACGFIE_17920 [Micromonospora sp. NPDC049275]|uniref:hypothetical protein n=1 Tax=Micromonospora sp. NPDC049275 TaxID=3364268 RepID=UPI0037204DE2